MSTPFLVQSFAGSAATLLSTLVPSTPSTGGTWTAPPQLVLDGNTGLYSTIDGAVLLGTSNVAVPTGGFTLVVPWSYDSSEPPYNDDVVGAGLSYGSNASNTVAAATGSQLQILLNNAAVGSTAWTPHAGQTYLFTITFSPITGGWNVTLVASGGDLTGTLTVTGSDTTRASAPTPLIAVYYSTASGGTNTTTQGSHLSGTLTATAGTTPTLAVLPTTASTTASGSPVAITATETNTTAGLAASLSPNLGTVSVTGTTITYTPPTTIGSSTPVTVTVTDATDGLTATCVVTVGPALGLAIGPLTLGTQTSAGVPLAWNTATGGTGPYSYKPYRNSTPVFTPPGTGTLLGTVTSLTFLDATAQTLTPSFYRLLVNDTTGAMALSVQNSNVNCLIAEKYTSPVVFIYLGDSITYANGYAASSVATSWYTLLAGIHQVAHPELTVSTLNYAIPGTTSAYWATSANLNPVIAEAQAAAPAGSTVFLLLGANDAKTSVATTPSAYLANILTICAAWVTAGFKVSLAAPMWIDCNAGASSGWSEAVSLPLLLAFRQQLETISMAGVTLDAMQLFEYFMQNPTLLTNSGVHPGDAGQPPIAEARYAGWVASTSANATTPTTAVLNVAPTGSSGESLEWTVCLNQPATGSIAFTGTVGSATISGTIPPGFTFASGTYTAPSAGTYTPTLTMGSGGSGLTTSVSGSVVISASSGGSLTNASIASAVVTAMATAPVGSVTAPVSLASFPFNVAPTASANATAVVNAMATAPVGSVANLTGMALDGGVVSNASTPTASTFTVSGLPSGLASGDLNGMSLIFQSGNRQGARRTVSPTNGHVRAGGIDTITLTSSLGAPPAVGDSMLFC